MGGVSVVIGGGKEGGWGGSFGGRRGVEPEEFIKVGGYKMW